MSSFNTESIEDKAARLFDTYGNSILRLAYSYLHSKEEAEEILQDTLIQFLKAKPELESSSHEKAWLLHVAANLSKNRIEYNKLRNGEELNEEITTGDEDKSDTSFVWEAVNKLPDKYRDVVHLYYAEGYDTKEIAKILDRKESTVRSDLKRGREKLKEILGKEYDYHG